MYVEFSGRKLKVVSISFFSLMETYKKSHAGAVKALL